MPYNNPGSSGPGGSVIGGLLVFSVGGDNYAALPVDINGNVTANVVPRVAADAVLALLSAQDGEIATSNDSASIWVQFPNQATAKPIYALGPASLDLADIASGRVGWFGPETVSYTLPAAGDLQYANIDALVAFLIQCEYSPNADVQITLGPGNHGSMSTTFDLPQVTFKGFPVEQITIDTQTVGAISGGLYPVTFHYTGISPTFSVGVLDIRPNASTSAALAFLGGHVVTGVNFGADTVSVNIKTDSVPVNGVSALTGRFFATTIQNVFNGKARFESVAFLAAIKLNATYKPTVSGSRIVIRNGASMSQITIKGAIFIVTFDGGLYATELTDVNANELCVNSADGVGVVGQLPTDNITSSLAIIANCKLGGSGIVAGGNSRIRFGNSTIANCDTDVSVVDGAQVALGLYTSVNNAATAARNAFTGDGSLVTGS